VANVSFVPTYSGLVHVFRCEPELIEDVDPRAVSLFGSFQAPSFDAPGRRWQPPGTDRTFAYLVVDGVIVREIRIPGELSIEVIGRGDVVLTGGDVADEFLPWAQCWERLCPARVAVLELPALTSLPGAAPVVAALAQRAAQRTDRNLVQMTISSVFPIKRRLELLLWHLAERWGFRRAGAIELPLRLTHRHLAALTSTRREKITKELVRLVADGVLEKMPQNHLRLVGPPPSHDLIAQAQESLMQSIGERET
jgi:CRP-like cAMP-binding protein